MKALIWKELREQRVLGVLALILCSVGMFMHASDSSHLARQVSINGGNANQELQRLLHTDFLLHFAIFSIIFGTLLGWMQIFQERHRDLWAYLIHRPATPTTILYAKLGAGLLLYVSAAGLPLLVFVLWVATPGHVPAPFEWSMALPSLAILLGGIVCYLTAMLLCLRQARWHGSRILPVGLPILTFMAAAGLPAFWHALAVILFAGTISFLAVRGSFQTYGTYSGQTTASKGALAICLAAGTLLIIIFASVALMTLLPKQSGGTYTYYQIGTDGTIYRTTSKNGDSITTDLAGKPLLDKATGRTLQRHELYNRFAPTWPLRISTNSPSRIYSPPYRESRNYFTFLKGGSGVLWYFWHHSGRVMAYDSNSRQILGSLGPDGFTPDVAGKDRFLKPYPHGYSRLPSAMTTGHNVYFLNLEERVAKPLLPASSQVVDAVMVDAERSAIIATRDSINLVNMAGEMIWSYPLTADLKDYDEIRFATLDQTNSYALQFVPSETANKASGGKVPQRFVKIEQGTGVVYRQDVPSHYQGDDKPPFQWKLLVGVIPPVLAFPFAALFHLLPDMWSVSLVYAISCVLIGLCVMRWDRMSASAMAGWSVFHFLCGLPGLIAFLAARDWPVKEKCGSCGKRHSVEREHCEHCNAPFPPPDRNGVEIFETAPSAP